MAVDTYFLPSTFGFMRHLVAKRPRTPHTLATTKTFPVLPETCLLGDQPKKCTISRHSGSPSYSIGQPSHYRFEVTPGPSDYAFEPSTFGPNQAVLTSFPAYSMSFRPRKRTHNWSSNYPGPGQYNEVSTNTTKRRFPSVVMASSSYPRAESSTPPSISPATYRKEDVTLTFPRAPAYTITKCYSRKRISCLPEVSD